MSAPIPTASRQALQAAPGQRPDPSPGTPSPSELGESGFGLAGRTLAVLGFFGRHKQATGLFVSDLSPVRGQENSGTALRFS